MKFELTKQKDKPGNVVQRFGDWRKGEPTVIIDNQRWLNYGKPQKVVVEITTEASSANKDCWCHRQGCGGSNQCGYGAAG